MARSFYELNKTYLLARISAEQMKEANHRKAGRLLDAKKCSQMIEYLQREVKALDDKYSSIVIREEKGAEY